jgi:signal transduction histidine kinase
MISTLWNKISQIGTEHIKSEKQLRALIYSNQILLVFFIVATALGIIIWIQFRWFISAPASFSFALTFLVLLALNSSGAYEITRAILSYVIPIGIVGVSILSKIFVDRPLEPYEFFEFRFVLLATPIIPLSVYHLSDKKRLAFALSINLLLLLLFDPIHEQFKAGYAKTGLEMGSYYFINVVSFLAFIMVVGSILILKSVNNRLENRLMDQRDQLTLEGIQLKSELKEKNERLIEINSELVNHNNELRQFSYTISHNLKGPVASLMGLAELLRNEKETDNKEVILDHIKKSTEALNSVVFDLTKIIDLRNSVNDVKEQVSFQEEFDQIGSLLNESVKDINASFNTDFQVAHIYSVKAFVSSILHNLVSNSVKYRSPERNLVVNISTYKKDIYTVFEIKDNGLGMDMDKYGGDIFKLYKRFHLHKEGKGLGLYMVKLQTEILGGKLEVKSKLNHGTTFKIYFKDLSDNSLEIIKDTKHATIFYDSLTNSSGVTWKGNVKGKIFREMALENLGLIKLYNTPNWISDIRQQTENPVEEQKWMIQHIMPQATANGLRRIAVITNKLASRDPDRDQYLEKVEKQSKSLGLTMQLFDDFDQARNWLLQFVKS